MYKKISIFTDGSCLGNPGAGGYAAILRYGNKTKKISAGYVLTTNNRMELIAAIEALKLLNEKCDVSLYSDSQYLRKGITEWINNWKSRNWRSSTNKAVKNRDLWQKIDALNQQHHIDWIWVKGHAGHPENEECDEMARAAANKPILVDEHYLSENH